MRIEENNIYNMDCIVGMSFIPDKSIDMILCDLPYGTTGCYWDNLLPFEDLWKAYDRIIKQDGVIVLTAAQPFTTKLIESNIKDFKYCWYWLKNQITGYPFAKYQPLRCVEDICVFYKKRCGYNPQGLKERKEPISVIKRLKPDGIYGSDSLNKPHKSRYTNYPRQTLEFKCQRDGLHPTGKPVALFEYLIKTYTNKGDVVLDNCIGSGTTAIAAINTDRKYIGFEIDKGYFNTSVDRAKKAKEDILK